MWHNPRFLKSNFYLDPVGAEMLLCELEMEEVDLARDFDPDSALGRLHHYFPGVSKRRMYVEAVTACSALVSRGIAKPSDYQSIHRGLLFELLVNVRTHGLDNEACSPQGENERNLARAGLFTVNSIRVLAGQMPVEQLRAISMDDWRQTIEQLVASDHSWETTRTGNYGDDPKSQEMQECSNVLRQWASLIHQAAANDAAQ